MAQMFLLMLGRLNPLISIIERGDSYAALTELMGGRVVEADLEGLKTKPVSQRPDQRHFSLQPRWRPTSRARP